MPKMKTNKSMSSRLKVTGSGRLSHRRPGKRHLLSKKTSKRKRHLSTSTLVAPGFEKVYKRLIGA